LIGEDLDHLLRWLALDPGQSGQRYEKLRWKLIEFFEYKGCDIPEELADRTLDRVARRLAEGEVILNENPIVYCLGVARKVLLEYWRSPERRKKVQMESLSPRENFTIDSRSAQEQAEDDELIMARRLECLTQCLRLLSPEDCRLIKQYYHDDRQAQTENRKLMAERLGLAHVGLRTKAHRIRRRLERCVKACVKRIQK
jgi:DNA-directed RNA polymerase specialized sigma24 family protein